MSLIATSISLQPKMPPACSFKAVSCISSLLLIPPQLLSSSSPTSDSLVPSNDTLRSKTCDSVLHSWQLYAVSGNSEPVPERKPNPDSKSKPKKRITHPKKTTVPQKEAQNPQKIFPGIIPRKPRRGRKSEAAAVEDFVRDSLGRTFASIREQNPEIRIDDEEILRKRANDGTTSDISDDEDDGVGERGQEMVVEEDNSNWPLDADVGWGIRASEYFENHPIKNVVAEDGTEIDWEGELDDNWVQEINCLEWETFAFHPSPMIVLVFERYNRATDNWKLLKEIEKALKVYWNAKNRLPPRAVKLDINIERDLAYALKVRECPQVLFLRGHKILYREKEFRNADELVRMIAYFYYNAKKPSWIDDAALTH